MWDFFHPFMVISVLAAIGGLIGGYVGDYAAKGWPHHGRIFACQFSVAIGIPFSVLILKVNTSVVTHLTQILRLFLRGFKLFSCDCSSHSALCCDAGIAAERCFAHCVSVRVCSHRFRPVEELGKPALLITFTRSDTHEIV